MHDQQNSSFCQRVFGRLGALVAVLCFLGGEAAAFNRPAADYRFQNTRSSSVGTAPALADIGPRTNRFGSFTADPRTVLRFPQGNGLELSPTTRVVPNRAYTIVLLFEFDSVTGFKRIIDFKNRAADSGLYIQSGFLRFYPHDALGTTAIPAFQPVQVALTRDSASKEVVGYVNGVEQFSFIDSANEAVISSADALRFFKDDGSEHSAGSVTRIRLYDRALSARAITALDRADFIVNSTKDAADNNPGNGYCYTGFDVNNLEPECTLRAAIQEANAAPDQNTINFGIATAFGSAPNPDCNQTSKVCTIKPSTGLPIIDETVVIDGYTQGEHTPGTAADDAKENTLSYGTNAALKIELNGEAADTSGLIFNPPDNLVRGLILNRWGFDAISINSDRNVVEGNFIGTDASGTRDRGNEQTGVQLYSAHENLIGGATPAARNLISGNDLNGIAVFPEINQAPTGNRIQGNLIGTDAGGTRSLGNSEAGVLLASAIENTVGGASAALGNVIAFNGAEGVVVFSSRTHRNRILTNSIFKNGGLGINLDIDSVTANDALDPDDGPNTLQNYPVLISATTSRTSTVIRGRINSTPDSAFLIQFFSTPAVDGTGFGEGDAFIGQETVRTDALGNASFSFSPRRPVPVGRAVTATATDRSGNTSEFSKARGVVRR